MAPRPGEAWVRESQVTAEELEAANAAVDEELPPSDTQEPCLSCKTCVELAKQLARNQHEREQAQLAAATYDPDMELPEGYERATRADLERLGLVDGDTSMLELDSHPDFHAETFARTDPETGDRSYVVGFRGTENWGTEYKQNFGQSLGFETAYYDQAAAIGTQARTSSEPITFVGHSLGGGLAATASGASGLPAQTFNAAGLSEATLDGVGFESPDLVDTTHVDGEILSRAQDATSAPDAYGIRRSVAPGRIPPKPHGLAESRSLRHYVQDQVDYSTQLHLMRSVQSALVEEERAIRSEMEHLGC